MKHVFTVSLVTLMAAASAAWAADVSIVFEARGLGSQVEWSQIANGFTLDVFLETDVPMQSAGISIDGDPGFKHAGTATTPFGTIANYEAAQGWSTASAYAKTFDPGSLPLPGGDGPYLGTIPANQTTGATRGLFAWLDFTEVPPQGAYLIQPGATSYASDMNYETMNIVSTTPLSIGGAVPPDGGNGDGGDGDGGSDGGDDDGGSDGGDGDGGDDGGDGDGGDDGGDGDGGDGGDGDGGDGGDGDGGDDGGDGDGGDGGDGDGGDGDGDGGDGGDGDGGGVILPPDDGGEEPADSPVAPAPMCAAGAVEAMVMSLVGLFVTQRRRRH